MLNSWRRRLNKEEYPLARKRASRLPSPDLYNVSEHALWSIGSALSSWRRGGGTQALDEAERNLLTLLEVCRELRARERS